MARQDVRLRNAARVRELKAAGLSDREVAARLGLSYSYVNELQHDPAGARRVEARSRLNVPCIDCGNPVHSDKPDTLRCDPCHKRMQREEAQLRVVQAMQRFAQRYGRPPAAVDFNPPLARKHGHHWRAERFYRDGDYPAVSAVQRLFGSWNKALLAAGLEPRGIGEYKRAPGTRRGLHLAAERPDYEEDTHGPC